MREPYFLNKLHYSQIRVKFMVVFVTLFPISDEGGFTILYTWMNIKVIYACTKQGQRSTLACGRSCYAIRSFIPTRKSVLQNCEILLACSWSKEKTHASRLHFLLLFFKVSKIDNMICFVSLIFTNVSY